MAHQGRFRARTAAAVATIVVGGAGAAHAQSLDVDRTLGAEAAAEVESTYGIVEHEKATAWVAAVGQRLVAGLGPQPFEYSFRLINMTEPNAFAVPAGHVFVAPSLLGLARSEDEVAGLIGHEIIHAHERHSVKRLRRGVLPGLLRVPGAIVGSVVDESLGKLINAPLSTLTQLRQASYSRGQEEESDRRGAELAAQAGYDPSALASLLERIDTGMEIVTGAASHFSYFDSHPFTPDRARDIRKRAAKLRLADTPPVASGPVEILERLDGLPIGPDPAQGVFQENVFLHPEMGFAIDFPPGWDPVNTASVVGAYEPEKRAQLFLGLVEGEPEYLAAAFVKGLREEYRTTPDFAGEVSAEGRTAHMVTLQENAAGRREPPRPLAEDG
jgi:predicted Zn-dependent protease